MRELVELHTLANCTTDFRIERLSKNRRGIDPESYQEQPVMLDHANEIAQPCCVAFARHANPSTTQRYNDAKTEMALDGQSFVFDLL